MKTTIALRRTLCGALAVCSLSFAALGTLAPAARADSGPPQVIQPNQGTPHLPTPPSKFFSGIGTEFYWEYDYFYNGWGILRVDYVYSNPSSSAYLIRTALYRPWSGHSGYYQLTGLGSGSEENGRLTFGMDFGGRVDYFEAGASFWGSRHILNDPYHPYWVFLFPLAF